MPNASGHKEITDQQIIEAYRRLQSPHAVAAELGSSLRNIQLRRRKIEEKYNIVLPVSDHRKAYNTAEIDQERAVYRLKVSDGQVIVGSDFHVWPGHRTTMQRAFIAFAKRLKPKAVILNGDVFDGATISRHPSIGWESKPSVRKELDAVGDFLGDLLRACGQAKRIWSAGNHDLRFESRIAANLPEFAGVDGVHLKDRFPEWTPCWRCDINDDVVVKHRMNGGEHADHNNVVKSGKTTVTGHDHRANVTAWRDYTGIRWGVRCGYMGESPRDPQFVHYLEASEPNWIPAFVVLTFRKGKLLWPELVTKFDDESVNWRGEVVPV